MELLIPPKRFVREDEEYDTYHKNMVAFHLQASYFRGQVRDPTISYLMTRYTKEEAEALVDDYQQRKQALLEQVEEVLKSEEIIVHRSGKWTEYVINEHREGDTQYEERIKQRILDEYRNALLQFAFSPPTFPRECNDSVVYKKSGTVFYKRP